MLMFACHRELLPSLPFYISAYLQVFCSIFSNSSSAFLRLLSFSFADFILIVKLSNSELVKFSGLSETTEQKIKHIFTLNRILILNTNWKFFNSYMLNMMVFVCFITTKHMGTTEESVPAVIKSTLM